MNIVVVDDEPALLESMRCYLTRLGHAVVGLQDARSAWEYFAGDPSGEYVIIIDLTLEGMSGEELIRKVIERKPDMAVIATSGYPPALHGLRELGAARLATLEKPFTPRMLTQALESLLTSQRSALG
jgi:DNA-binding NtrC family response regulator